MKGIVEERAVELGEYIIENKTTVRGAAKKPGIPVLSNREMKSLAFVFKTTLALDFGHNTT